MAAPGLCLSTAALLHRVELLVALKELGSTFFDTALLMVVKGRYTNALHPGFDASKADSEQQKAVSDFFMTYYLILRFVPIIPSLLLAKAGDRGWRRAPIVVPLSGYLLSNILLLTVATTDTPVEAMFGAAALLGLSGGFGAYWPGVMTLASLSSLPTDRSKAMMTVELLYGSAGLVGSLLSGHLFSLYSSSLGHGTILISVSLLLHLLSFMHAVLLLQVREVREESESVPNFLQTSNREETNTRKNKVNVFLLFLAAILYGTSVGGGVEILGIFVLKEPLSWNAIQVGYGNAAGSIIFLTSFLGVIILRRWFSDAFLIVIGMLSFTLGFYSMAFVTTTSMFYLARLLTLLALIPMPTIRSLLSKQVPSSSCNITLTSLQLALKIAGLAYIPAFTKIYQRTLDWFPWFVFLLSSVFSGMAMIPISIVSCRLHQELRYQQIQDN